MTTALAPSPDTLTLVINRRIDELERAMMQLPKAEMPVRHTFTPGLYGREMRLAAGTLVTGAIHTTEHQWILSAGRISVLTEQDGWQEFQAPTHGITKPGTRRVVYVHESAVFTTFHATTETDPDVIVSQISHEHREHLDGLVQPTLTEFLAARGVVLLTWGEHP